MSKKKSVARRSRDEWREIITGQETSGGPVASYCRQRQIHENSFYYWRKQLRGSVKAKPEEFIRVKPEDAGSTKSLCIQTPGGYRVEVAAGIDGAYVRSILAIVATLR